VPPLASCITLRRRHEYWHDSLLYLGAYWQAMQAGGAPTVWPQTLNPNPSTGWLPANLPNGIPTNAQAQTMLNSLPTIANPPTPANDGYNSGAPFGTWPGPRNGWTTRNTVLVAQALTTEQGAPADATVGSGNVVIGGTWQQPYDTTAGFPTTPVQTECTAPNQACVSGLPADHFVPTANAWITGADTWPDYSTAITVTQGGQTVNTTQGGQMLYDFSNDLSGPELLIVGNSTNSSKGFNGPQNWMPPNKGMYCAYAKMWIAVKWQWDLAVVTAPVGTVIFPNQTTGLSEQGALQYLLTNYC